MNSITPINLQKVSYLRNNQPHSLSAPNAVGQSSGDAYVPSFRGYEKNFRGYEKNIGKKGLIAGLFTGIFAKKNAEEEKLSRNAQAVKDRLTSETNGLSKEEIIEQHVGNLIEEIKKYEAKIESARNDYEQYNKTLNKLINESFFRKIFR